MRQVWHIFKKDFRYLRYEVSVVALSAAAFAILHFHTARSILSDPLLYEACLLIGIVMLMGRLLLAEPISGDRQFWVTRPYRWKSLLAAKLLFILAFVNVPILLAQFFIVTGDGFPLHSNLAGLLWMQVLLVFLWLPFAAFATLSAAKPYQVIVFAVMLLVGFGMTAGNGPLFGIQWLRSSFTDVTLSVIGAAILLIQYRTRRVALSRWLAAVGLLTVFVLLGALPLPLFYAVQSRFSKQPELGSSIHMTLGHGSSEAFRLKSDRPRVLLEISGSMQGIPVESEIHADAFVISLHSPDGGSEELECFNSKPRRTSAADPTISFGCFSNSVFFNRERDQPLSIHGSFYFTLFGDAQSRTIPLTGQTVDAGGGLRCSVETVVNGRLVQCNSPFRWPDRLIYATLGQTTDVNFTLPVSYSPFPANLHIEPFETRLASGDLPDVTIIAEEPLVHLRRDFELRDVHLTWTK